MSQGSGKEPSSGKRLAGIQAKIGNPVNVKFDRAENRDKILAGSFVAVVASPESLQGHLWSSGYDASLTC